MTGSSTDVATSSRDTVDAIQARFAETRTRPLAQGSRRGQGEEPERIGRYLIERRLGVGGMGVVYQALDGRVGRAVALKLMLVGDAEVDRERLRREAQALARLNHPNVVEVFEIGEHQDPGSSEPSRAYVAMELVDGHPLDRWLRLRERSVAEIVQVFAQAGEGLAAAHAQGLVHRDFKPSNVLVGNDGRVRVVDFGLVRESDGIEPSASALSDRDRSALGVERSAELQPRVHWSGSLTQTGAMVGTPAYMSPEQLTNLPVGPASDQFSFCVALYEALLGQHPFVVDGAWSKLPFNVLEGAIHRSPAERRIPRRLTRALLRGLAVRPEQRWPSMDVLLPELQRSLERRGPRPLLIALGGAAALGLLVVLSPSTTAVADRCEDAAATMREAWGPQARERLRATWRGSERPSDVDTWSRVDARMQAYAERWWSVHHAACSGPARAPSRALCLAGLAERARARLELLATPNDGLSEHAVEMIGALASVERCRAAFDDPAPAPLDDPQDMLLLHGELEHVDVLLQAGMIEDARGVLEGLLGRAERERNAPLIAEIELRVGQVQLQTGNFEGAEAVLERTYLEAKRLGRDRLAAESALAMLQLFGHRNYRQDDAARWARHARTETERIDDPRLNSRFHHAWGRALHGAGDLEQALEEHEQALAVVRSLPDAEDEELATSLLYVSSTLNQLGRGEEGRPYAEQALELHQAALGPRHPQLAADLMNLGGFALLEKKRVEALAYYERALSIMQERSPDDPGFSWAVLLNISTIHRHDGHPQQAADALRRFLDIVERSPDPTAVDPSRVAWVRGEIAMLERRYEDALVQYERASEGEGVQRYEETRGLLGVATALLHLGRLEESIAVHRRLLGLLEPKPGTVPDLYDINDRVATLQSLAQTLVALGDHQAALDELRLARALVVALPDPAETAIIDAQLGAQLSALGRSDEALPALQEALRTLEAGATVDLSWVVEGLVALGEAELATGHAGAALAHAERAVGLVDAHEGERMPTAAQAWFLLARCLGASPEAHERALLLARRAQQQWALEGVRSGRALAQVSDWLDGQGYVGSTNLLPPP